MSEVYSFRINSTTVLRPSINETATPDDNGDPKVLIFETLTGESKVRKKGASANNKVKWTIYVGLCKPNTSNKIIKPLNGTVVTDTTTIINHFNNVSEPIKDWYLNNTPMGEDLYGYIVVDSHNVTSQQETVNFGVLTMIKKGTNLGKANATNPLTQAIKKAQSMFDKKVKEYTPKMNILPQLAEGDRDLYGPDITTVEKVIGKLYRNNVKGVRVFHDMEASPLVSNMIRVTEKLDGIHGLAHIEGDKVVFTSRKGTELICGERIKKEAFQFITKVNNYIKEDFDDDHSVIINFEMYRRGVPLKIIHGWTSTTTGEHKPFHGMTVENLEMHVFDCLIVRKVKDPEDLELSEWQYEQNTPAHERTRVYGDLVLTNIPYLQRIEYPEAVLDESGDEFKYIKPLNVLFDPFDHPNATFNEIVKITNDGFQEVLKHGGEGAMVIGNWIYEPGTRHNIYKLKPMLSKEFILVGYETGMGNNADKVKLILQTTKDTYEHSVELHKIQFDYPPKPFKEVTFKSAISGITDDENRNLLIEFETLDEYANPIFESKYKGREVTVEFANYSEDHKPTQPSAKIIL
jgi:hypothetical protein